MSRLAGRIKVTFNNASFQEEFDLKFPSRNSRATAVPATYAPSSFPLEAALSPSLIWKCPLFCLEGRCCHSNGTHRVNSLENTLQISYAIFVNANSPSYPTPLPSSSERKPWKLETKNILAWLFGPHGAACEPCMATITVSIDTYRHIMGHCYPDGAFPSAFFFVSVLAGFAPVSLAVCSVSFFSLPLSVLLPPLRLQSGGSQAGWRQWSPTRLSEGWDCPGWTSGAQLGPEEDVGPTQTERYIQETEHRGRCIWSLDGSRMPKLGQLSATCSGLFSWTDCQWIRRPNSLARPRSAGQAEEPGAGLQLAGPSRSTPDRRARKKASVAFRRLWW